MTHQIRRLKRQLMRQIANEIKNQGLTQVSTAKKLGLSQGRISHLVNERIGMFSLDVLINVLSKYGKYVDMRVK